MLSLDIGLAYSVMTAGSMTRTVVVVANRFCCELLALTPPAQPGYSLHMRRNKRDPHTFHLAKQCEPPDKHKLEVMPTHQKRQQVQPARHYTVSATALSTRCHNAHEPGHFDSDRTGQPTPDAPLLMKHAAVF